MFVHGFACDHSDWQAQTDFFSKTSEVAACDLRGHGATPGRPNECTIEHYGGDVAALVVHLEFSHYDPAPPQLQQKLVAAHKPALGAED